MNKVFEFLQQLEIRNVLAVIYILLCFVYIYALLFHKVPAESKDLVNVLGGAVFGGITTIIGFYFGSSKNTPQVQ